MLLDVLDISALPRESHLAVLAPVGFVPRVPPHVADERVLLVERHRAEGAGERSVAGVDSHVPLQVPHVCKGLAAVRALEGTVATHMGHCSITVVKRVVTPVHHLAIGLRVGHNFQPPGFIHDSIPGVEFRICLEKANMGMSR